MNFQESLLNEKSQSGKVTYNIIQAYKGDKNNRELNTHTGEDKEKTWEIWIRLVDYVKVFPTKVVRTPQEINSNTVWVNSVGAGIESMRNLRLWIENCQEVAAYFQIFHVNL